VEISSWVGACPFTPLPFEDHPSTQARQTGLRNKPKKQAPGKADQGNNSNNTHMDC